MKKLIIILIIISTNLFSQEYEIAWEKDIGGSYAQFSKDGEFIYVAVGSNINKFRSSDGSFVSTFDNSGVPYIYGMNISSSGNYIVTRDGGGGSNIWDVKAEKAIKQVTNMVNGDILNDSIAISIFDLKNGSNKIGLFNFIKGKEVKSIITNNLQVILKVSHNGKMFATASIYTDSQKNKKFYLTLWNTDSLTEIKRFELEAPDNQSTFMDIKFSLDDQLVGVCRQYPYEVEIFDTKTFSSFINSNKFDKRYAAIFDFVNNLILIDFIDPFVPTYDFYIIDKNTKLVNQKFNLITAGLTTSQNNLIFTGDRLLRPKTVGVTENEQNRLLISPNPASDYIEINVGAGSKPALENPGIEIFNIFGEKNPTLSLPIGEGTGKVLPTGEDLGGVFKIDVSNLAPGVYFIKIGDKFEKFVKM
jgi:hypothetical protein